MLPNFFVLGAQKSGTTTLHHLLVGHPEIYLPKQKETKFFARDSDWESGIEFYERNHFSGIGTEKSIGEIDPDYMFYESVLDRMLKVYGDLNNLKFIFILRNPIDRALSHYLMSLRRGHEVHSFNQAIEMETDRVSEDYKTRMHFSYLARGLYYRQIKRFLNYIDRDRVLILFSEDLANNQLGEIQKVCEFLGVSKNYIPENLKQRYNTATKPRFRHLRRIFDANDNLKTIFRTVFPFVNLRQKFKHKILKWNEKGSYKNAPEIDEGTRKILRYHFDNDIKQLEKMCQRDLDYWV